jgi:hypothetical protein
MTRHLSGLGAAFVLAGAVLAPRPAAAYVRYLTMSGVPFAWPQSCVPLTAYPKDLTDMTSEAVVNAALGAAEAWGPTQNSCSFLDIQLYMSTDATPQARYDRRNSLIFRHDSWCRWDDPVGSCSYDQAALAITSVFVTPDGNIRDGDIEVNARYFAWTDVLTDPNANGKQDLQNALTHEMGHLIGLDHTCVVAGAPTTDQYGHPLLDNTGAPVPDCTVADQAVKDSTMYPSAMPGDTSKRTLSTDDSAAVCAIYPLASDPKTCPGPNPPSSSGCSTGPGAIPAGGGGLAALAAVAILFGVGRRRRGRPRS